MESFAERFAGEPEPKEEQPVKIRPVRKMLNIFVEFKSEDHLLNEERVKFNKIKTMKYQMSQDIK